MSMAAPSSGQITELLLAWREGDREALETLTLLVHRELHRLAKVRMSRQPLDHTLQTTALINETYLRLMERSRQSWQNRTHFFAVAAQMMRCILVDYARSRRSIKRGAGARCRSLQDPVLVRDEQTTDLIAVDEALRRLASVDPRKARIVELRFFGGLTVDETAEVLKVSPFTVLRDWRFAKAWLHQELARRDNDES
jgi:RNA polymerase sigma factor (TIGR02999 family)